jgi:hypothetical protein
MSGRPTAASRAATTAWNCLEDPMLKRSISTFLTVMFLIPLIETNESPRGTRVYVKAGRGAMNIRPQ